VAAVLAVCYVCCGPCRLLCWGGGSCRAKHIIFFCLTLRVSAVGGAAVPAALCRWGLCPRCHGGEVFLGGIRIIIINLRRTATGEPLYLGLSRSTGSKTSSK